MSAMARRCVLIGCVVVAASGCGGSPSGHRAPAVVERSLPIDLYLANLCPAGLTDRKTTTELRRQARVLIREARVHPDWLVEYTYYSEDGADERRLITIRQLAREHLQSLEDQDRNCEPGLQRQLEAVTQ
jgi:hypothetical protein